MVSMGGEIALSAAMAASEHVDINLAFGLANDHSNAAGIGVIGNALKSAQESYGVFGLYLLGTDQETVYYLTGTDTETQPGSVFRKSYAELSSAFAGEQYVSGEIVKTEKGFVINAYVPIKKGGEVIAVLGCDYDAAEIVAKSNSNTVTAAIIAVVCLAVSGLLVMLVIGRVSRNLKRVDAKVYELANNEGDLTQSIDINSGDETELIANNLNALLYYIKDIMLKVSHNADELKITSAVVVGNLEDSETNISDVSATMEEMSASMEEMSDSINRINVAISDMYSLIETMYKQAVEGNKNTGKILEKAKEIHSKAVEEGEKAQEMSVKMEKAVGDKIEKSKAVERINSLTEEIINITDQTNLLSLNASIEAARAGEAGRGFAVVAEEIGKLANDSGHAASQIQSVSEVVIEAVNELAQESERILKFLNEVAMNGYVELQKTSREYHEDVKDMNELMNQFADRSKELRKNADDIKQTAEAVNAAVEENTKGIVNVSQMAVSLNGNIRDIGEKAKKNEDIAGLLHTEVSKFKLE